MSVDVNFQSYADLDGFSIVQQDDIPGNPEAYQDTLKLSHSLNFTFDGGTVRGGTENAIDCNRMCSNGLFNRMTLVGGDQSAIVVKGGCLGMVFADIVITPSPLAWCDVLWDDWSDQSQAPSTGLLKNVTRADGRPVRLVAGRGTWPAVKGGNVRRCYFFSFALRSYNWGKGILRKLKLV